MSRASEDVPPRERKRLKVTFEKVLAFTHIEAETAEYVEILEIIRKELPCAQHLRIRAQVSGIEIKWDKDKLVGEDHRNSLHITNVPLAIMRQRLPLLEEVTNAATDVRDMFIIDELNGVASRAVIQAFSEKGYWVSLKRLSLWYLRDFVDHRGELPVESFSALMPGLKYFSLCGTVVPASSLSSVLSKFPALEVIALHNRTLRKQNFSISIREDFAQVFGNDVGRNLTALTVSGLSWSEMGFVQRFLVDRPSLEMIEFDARDLTDEMLSQVLGLLPETSITELRIYDMRPDSGPELLSLALRDPACRLLNCKLIQPAASKFPCTAEIEFTEAVKVNRTLRSLTLPRSGRTNDTLEKEREHYLKLNRLGRKHLYCHDFHIGLWPMIVKKANDSASVIHSLLREKPDFLVSPRESVIYQSVLQSLLPVLPDSIQ